MTRILLLVSCLLVLPLSGALADTPGTAVPSIALAVTPVSAPAAASRNLIGHGLPTGMRTPAVVFAPSGSQTAFLAETDGDGNLSLPLMPPGGFTEDGVYRVVLDLGIGQSRSVLFYVGDGKPLLSADPAVFSPYSALQILGADLPPNQGFDLVLTPANDRGDRIFPVSTDAQGLLQAYIWPQDLGESFFEAGEYRVALPALGLSDLFQVREKPVGANVTVLGPALSGGSTPVHFRQYGPKRFLWTIYADASDRVSGEMLYGVTDPTGALDVWSVFDTPTGGQYRLATPYDWGEATFTAIPPTPTPTPTPTDTPTPTPTATDPPSPTPVKTKKVCKKKNGKKRCKRVPVGPDA